MTIKTCTIALTTLACVCMAAPAQAAKGKGKGKSLLTEHRKLELQSARAKGTTAYIGAGSTALFGIGSMALNGTGPPAYMMGTGALLSTAITLPVGAGGGNQARRLAATVGVPAPNRGLQTVAWAGYGLTMVNGLALITLGVMDLDVPTYLIGSTVLLGTVSTASMGVDAITTANAVEEELRKGRRGNRRVSRTHFLSVQPAVSVSKTSTHWGVQGTF